MAIKDSKHIGQKRMMLIKKTSMPFIFHGHLVNGWKKFGDRLHSFPITSINANMIHLTHRGTLGHPFDQVAETKFSMIRHAVKVDGIDCCIFKCSQDLLLLFIVFVETKKLVTKLVVHGEFESTHSIRR